MKNDILLFVVMFAVAWIGYNVAKDRLQPAATEVVESEAVASNAIESAREKDPESTKAKTAEREIEKILIEQTRAWNRGDLYGFMEAYWNSEDLTMSGDGETTLGWGAVYSNYREKYPDGEMGKIDFKDIKTEMVGKEAAIVTGRFYHQLADEKVNGNFSLVVRKIFGLWKIVHDTTAVSE